MENMYLKHMTDAEKKIYNKNYYQRNKQYWVLWRAEHGQNGKQTGVPVAGKAQSLKGTRLSEEEIRKRKSDSYWDQYNKKAKLDYLKRNAQYEKAKWEQAREALIKRKTWGKELQKRAADAKKNYEKEYEQYAKFDYSQKNPGSSIVPYYMQNTSKEKQKYIPKWDSDLGMYIYVPEDPVAKVSPRIKYYNDEAKAKANMADAQRRAAKFSGRNKPVASLPASSAPGYSKYKNEIKPLLDQKLDALKYAANIAKEKTKEVLKSIWDLL